MSRLARRARLGYDSRARPGDAAVRILVMLVALAACTGSEGGSPSGVVTDPLTGARSMELTEPWKSMNLPIDGAVVQSSTERSLLVRFPTVPAEDMRATHAAMRQALVDAGWRIDEEGDEPTGPWSYVTNPSGIRGTFSTLVDDGRPSSRIALVP